MEIQKITDSSLPSLPVIKFRITTLSFDEQALLILRWARQKTSKMVCLANVHMLMEAYWSQEFGTVLEKADMIVSDGMPLVWVLKVMGVLNQQRVAGMDLFLKLCEFASLCDIGIFFLGSQAKILKQIRSKLEQDYPNLKISGMEPLPFRPLFDSEDRELVQKINGSGAGIVLVCLGCPKQENWMAEHLNQIQAVMIGVGAVFPVYAGIQKRAPRILRDCGTEWMYRLIQEPRRLWPRYSTTIPPFVYLVTQQIINQFKSQLFNPFLIQSDFILGNQINPNLLKNSRDLDMVPAKIGEILEKNYLVDKQRLSLALDKQKSIKKRLGEMLIEEKIIIQPELDYFLANQKTTLTSLLINRKIVSSAKMQEIANKINIGNEKSLSQFLLKNQIISESLLKLLLVEKYLRIKGFWLNHGGIEQLIMPTVNSNSNHLVLDPAHQF